VMAAAPAKTPASPAHKERHAKRSHDQRSHVQLAATFTEALQKLYPGAIECKEFLGRLSSVCHKQGFTKENTIAMYSVCRDELNRSFTNEFEKHWGNSFDISSLAGMVFCGRTGLAAGMSHAPIEAGRARYVFWVGPHIAISSSGEVGKVMRHGIDAPSHACGALLKFHDEILNGQIDVKPDDSDLEQGLVKRFLLGELRYGNVPSLVDLTAIALTCVNKMFDTTLKDTVHPAESNYVVASGVLIHGPDHTHWIWCPRLEAMLNERMVDLKAHLLEPAHGTTPRHAGAKPS